MILPKRANSVGGAGGGRVASISPAVRHGNDATTWPWASITALIPVGVERITGMPSSEILQLMSDELKRHMRARIEQCRRLAKYINDPRTTEALLRMADEGEADLAPAGKVDGARTGTGVEVDVARREPRQADR